MLDRRLETRILCADLIDLRWQDKSGKTRRTVANLEDISLSGACLQLDHGLPLQTPVRIRHTAGDLTGTVRYCVFRDIGYFLGVEFDAGCRWSSNSFRPQHLLDPRELMTRGIDRALRRNAEAAGSSGILGGGDPQDLIH